MMRIAAFGAAFLDFVRAVFPVMALYQAAVTHFVFVNDLQLVIGVGVFSIAQLTVECLWGRPFSVHHAHHGSFVVGGMSRLLGAFGEWWPSLGMLALGGNGVGGVALGGFLVLRMASRYSLSPPGVLFWAFGMGFRVFFVGAV